MVLIRSIRMFVNHKKVIRKAFKISFSQKDSSFFIFPYGKNNEYYYGYQSINGGKERKKFRYNNQFHTGDIPKLSFHQSGQVKIRDLKENLAGPIYTIPVNNLRGEHIASVSIDSFDNLPKYTGKIKSTGADIDHIIKSDNVVGSGKIVIYCNSKEKKFNNTKPCNLIISMNRPLKKSLTHICFEARGQEPLSIDFKGGTVVIAGFNPRRNISSEQQFLFIYAL